MSQTLEDNIVNFLDDICTNSSNDMDQSFSSILELCPVEILQKTDEHGNTFLMKACTHQPQVVKSLIESGKIYHLDYVRKNSQGLNALCIACISQPDALKIMLEKVPRIDEYLRSRCLNDWTPAMYASFHNSKSLSHILTVPVCSTKYLKMTGTDGHNVITLGCLNSDTKSLEYLINEPKCTVELFEESVYENKTVLMLLINEKADLEIIETFFNSSKCSPRLVCTMMDDKTSALSYGCMTNIDVMKLILNSDKCTQEFVRSHDWSKIEFIDDEVKEFVMAHDKYEKVEVEIETEDIEQSEVQASAVQIEFQHANLITIDDAKIVPNERLNELRRKLKELMVESAKIELEKAKIELEKAKFELEKNKIMVIEHEKKLQQTLIELEIEIIVQNAGLNT